MKNSTKNILIGLGLAGVTAGLLYWLYKEEQRKEKEREEQIEKEISEKFEEDMSKVQDTMDEKYPIVDTLFEELNQRGISTHYSTDINFKEEDNDDEEEGEVLIKGDPEGFYEEGRLGMKIGLDTNSEEAKETYEQMLLADYTGETREIMSRFADLEFIFEHDGDSITYDTIGYTKERYFGKDSQWRDEITWLDFLHYEASRLNFDLDGDIQMWTRLMLRQMDITEENFHSVVGDVTEELLNHEYTHPMTGTYGLFGLDDEGFDYLMNESLTEGEEVTFERELNSYIYIATKRRG